MSEFDIKETVNRRNTETFKEAIESLNARLFDAHEKIRLQSEAMAAIQARMSALEQQINIAKVLMTGTGPTVR